MPTNSWLQAQQTPLEDNKTKSRGYFVVRSTLLAIAVANKKAKIMLTGKLSNARTNNNGVA